MFCMARIVRLLPIVLAGAFLSACTMWPEKPTAWSNATGAEQLERLWWQAVKSKNWTEVESHLTSTFVYQSSGTVRDRDAALELLKKLDVADYALGDVTIHPSGDAAIVTYTIDLKGTYDGRPLELSHARMMSVWQQQKRGWAIVAHADSLQ